MNVTLLQPGDPRWPAVLAAHPHDVYHLPGYTALEAYRVGGNAVALLGESPRGTVLLPLVIRALPLFGTETPSGGWSDAASPYGYPGAIVAGEGNAAADLVPGFLEEARQLLHDLGVVSVFLRLNPILNDASCFAGKGTLVAHGETVWLDLLLSQEELNRQTRERFRGYVNAARRDGLVVEHDVEWRELPTFTALYHQTMRSVGADSLYFFPESYFRALREQTGGTVHLFTVRSRERIAAAGLFSDCAGIVQYLFSGKEEAGGHPHSTKLMMVHVRDWAKGRGSSVMHLGGGLGGSADNLGHFKRGFSKLTKTFHTWRWVVDEVRFRDAAHAWVRQTSLAADDERGFFPPYRKPTGGGHPGDDGPGPQQTAQ